MDKHKPWFVLVTGPMRWQVKPYAWQGWAVLAAWMFLLAGLMLLLWPLRERWWIVTAAVLALTLPLVVFSIRMAVPIERVGAGSTRRQRRQQREGRSALSRKRDK